MGLAMSDPLNKARGATFAVAVFWIALVLIVLLLTTCSAKANDELVLNGKSSVHLTRTISVVIVDKVPDGYAAAGSPSDLYAVAKNADGAGRCVVFIRRDKLAYLYHELQHCAGESHE
jgi:hypothetical protein